MLIITVAQTVMVHQQTLLPITTTVVFPVLHHTYMYHTCTAKYKRINFMHDNHQTLQVQEIHQ